LFENSLIGEKLAASQELNFIVLASQLVTCVKGKCRGVILGAFPELA
jgi:hypothetical protein